ncbi:hypothetical protein [Streptomyces sp. NPDC005538]|uniref:hypothetical protein n=1 Tax=unclassified Streptomyces TaxID=2593676 RepID=UPI0033B8AD63
MSTRDGHRAHAQDVHLRADASGPNRIHRHQKTGRTTSPLHGHHAHAQDIHPQADTHTHTHTHHNHVPPQPGTSAPARIHPSGHDQKPSAS